MPIISLKFSLSDEGLAVADRLRDTLSRDQYFRLCVRRGHGDFLMDAVQRDRDFLTHQTEGNTLDYKQGRNALLAVDDPDNATPERSPSPPRVVS